MLNILDSLAGDDRLHRLAQADAVASHPDQGRGGDRRTAQDALEDQAKFSPKPSNKIDTAEKEFRKKIADLESRTDLDPRIKEQMLERERIRLGAQLATCRSASLEKERNQKVKESERELAAKIRGVQDRYKLLAVLLPPIPPILLAFFVFFHRRKAEQEGVDTRRLRYGRSRRGSGCNCCEGMN